MKYGLIGCGRISANHIAAALDNNLEVVAICDIVSERMEEKIKQFDSLTNVKQYVDYKEMLKNEKLDLVAIATESGKHASIALDCIKAGCNVIIEKPIALSIKDVDDIIKTADEYGVCVSVCHQNRFNKSILKIREAIDQNRFGKLLYGTAHIRWNRGEDYYKQALWRGTWEQDGGALMNQCIHNIDLLVWMLGSEIEEIFAYTDQLCHDYIEAEDIGIALIKFKNGSYGIIEGTTDLYLKNLKETLYIFGEKGTVKAGGKSVNILEEWLFGDNFDNPQEIKQQFSEMPSNVYGFGHTPLYRDVIDAIINKRKPYVDAIQGKIALQTVLGIYKSSLEHKPIKMPLDNVSSIDFKGRFDDEIC